MEMSLNINDVEKYTYTAFKTALVDIELTIIPFVNFLKKYFGKYFQINCTKMICTLPPLFTYNDNIFIYIWIYTCSKANSNCWSDKLIRNMVLAIRKLWVWIFFKADRSKIRYEQLLFNANCLSFWFSVDFFSVVLCLIFRRRKKSNLRNSKVNFWVQMLMLMVDWMLYELWYFHIFNSYKCL